jgi:maltose alpha-D-glucosyltransferase/alpha-amylase
MNRPAPISEDTRLAAPRVSAAHLDAFPWRPRRQARLRLVIGDLWYKNAVFYCLHVGTFMDTDGDGVGDFAGLMQRIDYLAGLGITCIWLMPFQPSPQRDGGYDISDYYSVDPRYGTLGDFTEFTRYARQRGIRVIIDLVVNHTSDKHPWFVDARSSKSSRHRDWYVWSKTRPTDANEGMVFPGVQKSTWTKDAVSGEYYFHRFYEFQPDLATSNPEVIAEIRKIMGFWLELGVDGFRIDAVPFVISGKGAASARHVEHYDMLRDLREFVQWRKGDAVLLAEANVLPKTDMRYFGEAGERMHMMFNFQVNQHLFYALASGDTRPLAKSLASTRAKPASAQWGNFLRNHDELDLGRLTDSQREAVFAAFGPEKRMQLYDRGIRRRLAPMLHGDHRRMALAYSLLFSLPGTPVLRYGDELGMGDDLRLKERAAARTPMQWSDEPNAGFSTAEKTALPVIASGPFAYTLVNAADQRGDPESFLNWTERMIRMRKECPELGWGDFEILDTGNHGVLGICTSWKNNSVLTLHNFSGDSTTVRFALGTERGRHLVDLFSTESVDADARGRHTVTLEPHAYRWFRVGGLDHVLHRRLA